MRVLRLGLKDFWTSRVFPLDPPQKKNHTSTMGRLILFNSILCHSWVCTQQFSPLYLVRGLDCISKTFWWFWSFCTEGLQEKNNKKNPASRVFWPLKKQCCTQDFVLSILNWKDRNIRITLRETHTHTELSFIEESRRLALSICTEAGPLSLSGAQWSCWKAEATCSRLCQNLIRLKRRTAGHRL